MKNIEILAEAVAQITKSLYSIDQGDIPDDKLDSFVKTLADTVSGEGRRKAEALRLVQEDANLADDEKTASLNAAKLNADLGRLVEAKARCVKTYKQALADLKVYNAKIKETESALAEAQNGLDTIKRRRMAVYREYLEVSGKPMQGGEREIL